MRTRPILFAALATAGVALSACTQTVVAGEARTAPTTMTAQVAVAESATSTAPGAVAPARWIDVTMPGGPTRPDRHGKQYGALPVPGVKVLHQDAGTWRSCTTGPVVHSADGSRVGLVTAKHCVLEEAPDQYLQTDADGTRAFLGRGQGVAWPGDDLAVVWSGTYNPAATISSVGGFPVERVMSPAEAAALPEGTPICALGAVSGLRCGPKSMPAVSRIRIGDAADGLPVATRGDSGGAVFVVDAQTRRATLIGLVATSGGGLTNADYLAPALEQLSAVAVTVAS